MKAIGREPFPVVKADPTGSGRETGVTLPQVARVFVGLKIASEIADELAHVVAVVEHPAVRRIAPADIHLTLVPPWNEVSMSAATERLGWAAERSAPFWLTCLHVGYGPEVKRPRLIWADCAVTEDITALRTTLLQAFEQNDPRPFRPHVTLARIRGNGAAIARKHPLDRNMSLTQRVASVELFRSPPPGERGYRIVASRPLGGPGAPP